MSGRIHIDEVFPAMPAARYPAKAVAGEHVPVLATIWRDGHQAVGGSVVWRGPGEHTDRVTRMSPADPDQDRWSATIVPDRQGNWTFRVDGWSDPWTTWRAGVIAKLGAGIGLPGLADDLEQGAGLLRRAASTRSDRPEGRLLAEAARVVADPSRPLRERIAAATGAAVSQTLHDEPIRDLVTRGSTGQVRVDRPRALVGSWYEFFPRSTGGVDHTGTPVHGTFATAAAALDRIAAMQFDVVYLPPIHPIGTVNRKGRDNALVARPGDVGSPWAIGSAAGGHDAINPDLGTMADFDAFVARAGELGLEVALDLALQCAPDHPWVRDHPEWFVTRADGRIAFAENPPKTYEDIYPLDFDRDVVGLRAEVLRIVLLWIEHGVRIFRVDNPHTKPPDFWHWLIRQVKQTHPDVVFHAEAFTRPARLYGLARLGFDQGVTYFTWRTTKAELTEFGLELVAHAHEARPNLFVTTPDILPADLQLGLPAAGALRAALAATLGPSWGVYSGFELHESEAREPGGEEHRHSEKYELRPRDFAAAAARGESLELWLTRLNQLRRDLPALRQLRTLRFHDIDNDQLIAYSKTDPATRDSVVCVVNLDPRHPQEGTLRLDLAALGRASNEHFVVHDEVSGQSWRWGPAVYVRLDPAEAVAHVVDLGRPQRRDRPE